MGIELLSVHVAQLDVTTPFTSEGCGNGGWWMHGGRIAGKENPANRQKEMRSVKAVHAVVAQISLALQHFILNVERGEWTGLPTASLSLLKLIPCKHLNERPVENLGNNIKEGLDILPT
jgi:hypothetical protein